MRNVVFVLTILIGLTLAVAGFFLAAPIGPTSDPVYSNPRMAFSPAMFTLGVMIVFLSAVVYELFPGGD